MFLNVFLDKYDCYDYGGDWINSDIRFDNIYDSVFSMYQIGTGKGWVAVMFDTIDSTGVNF